MAECNETNKNVATGLYLTLRTGNSRLFRWQHAQHVEWQTNQELGVVNQAVSLSASQSVSGSVSQVDVQSAFERIEDSTRKRDSFSLSPNYWRTDLHTSKAVFTRSCNHFPL